MRGEGSGKAEAGSMSERCWNCNEELAPGSIEAARKECKRCFADKDGPYEEDVCQE